MQIVGFKWKNDNGWKPNILIEKDGIKFFELFDSYISLKVGERFCIGYFLNSKKNKCPKNEKLIKGTICDSCKELDHYYKCIQCVGECINEKNRESCKQTTFYMYFTTFGSLLKIGISQEHRFFERMIEQGAELGVKFSRIKDGKEARLLEQSIKKLLYCEDRIYGDIKEKNIFGDPNTVVLKIREALKNIKEHGYGTIGTEIYDFRRYYRLDNIGKDITSLDVYPGSVIEGEVVAVKGNIIILKKGHVFYSVNSHKLISREISDFSIKPIKLNKIMV